MQPSLMLAASLLLLLLLAIGCQGFPDKTDAKATPVREVLDKVESLHSDMSRLASRVQALDSDIADVLYKAEDCSVGVNNDICTGGDIDRIMTLREKVSQVGKRDPQVLRPLKAKRLVENLSMKRYMLALLRKYLQDVAQVFREDRKRSCNVNLSFHCQTGEYSDFADMYEFLQRGISPGKRKRSALPPGPPHPLSV